MNGINLRLFVLSAINDVSVVLPAVIQDGNRRTKVGKFSKLCIDRSYLPGVLTTFSRPKQTGPTIKNDPRTVPGLRNAALDESFKGRIARSRYWILSKSIPNCKIW